MVDALSAGEQPDAAFIDRVGYLMRTTAVYGSGKFGAADRSELLNHDLGRHPFRLEMLNVYLIREFVLDLVEHIAAQRGGEQAAVLDPELRQRLGIGNSTGLGMAPFLVNHPALLHQWMLMRETALVRVRNQACSSAEKVLTFRQVLHDAVEHAATWHSEHPIQQQHLEGLK